MDVRCYNLIQQPFRPAGFAVEESSFEKDLSPPHVLQMVVSRRYYGILHEVCFVPTSPAHRGSQEGVVQVGALRGQGGAIGAR